MCDDENDEAPSEVWFQNHQWSVTDYGVESVRPGAPNYHFDKTRLLETGNHGGEMYDWPPHMEARGHRVDCRDLRACLGRPAIPSNLL